jgi:hypothetical protein
MKIVDIARTYVGKKEIPQNAGFVDQTLENEMLKCGWQKGFAWCAIIAKLWAKKAYPDNKDLDRLFSASAVQTFNNFKRAGYEISEKPVLGSIVIWQRYKDGQRTWQGHAGVVSQVISDKEFKSIEGNSSPIGSREGDRVVENPRVISKKETGLNVLGFIILK